MTVASASSNPPTGSVPSGSGGRRQSRRLRPLEWSLGLAPVLVAAVVVPFAAAVLAAVLGPLPTVVLLAGSVAVVALVRREFDGVTALTILVVLLFFVPSRQVIGPLGAAGTPAAMVGLVAAALWATGTLVPRLGLARGQQPVRLVLLAFAAAHLASYAAAFMRPIDFLEKNAADRGLITVVSSVGVALLAVDGIATRTRLDTLLRRIAVAGTGLALLGIVQFVFGFDLAARIDVPGLVNQVEAASFIDQRSIFRRVAGTTKHAIEFSVVLAMIFPLVLHFVMFAGRDKRRRWWLALSMVVVALPMSVSRTAAVAMAAVALVLVPSWTKERRRKALFYLALYAVAMKLMVPGLLGTIRALFLRAGDDPSISARQSDYSYVKEFIVEQPLFGRGFSTFIPTRYDFLDNQFLISLVETGVVGLLALLALIFVGMGVATVARRVSSDPQTRDLAQSLAASLIVVLVSCATFDFLSFPTARLLAFLLVGCSGALWRLQQQPERTPQGKDPGPEPSAIPAT